MGRFPVPVTVAVGHYQPVKSGSDSGFGQKAPIAIALRSLHGTRVANEENYWNVEICGMK
jgi:hypothetical protein